MTIMKIAKNPLTGFAAALNFLIDDLLMLIEWGMGVRSAPH